MPMFGRVTMVVPLLMTITVMMEDRTQQLVCVLMQAIVTIVESELLIQECQRPTIQVRRLHRQPFPQNIQRRSQQRKRNIKNDSIL
jgi:hypothetical protein